MEFFSDEGSGYWLGRRAFELFAKQSDGRKPKGKLHELLKKHLKLEDDSELNNLVREVYAPSREKPRPFSPSSWKRRRMEIPPQWNRMRRPGGSWR